MDMRKFTALLRFGHSYLASFIVDGTGRVYLEVSIGERQEVNEKLLHPVLLHDLRSRIWIYANCRTSGGY